MSKLTVFVCMSALFGILVFDVSKNALFLDQISITWTLKSLNLVKIRQKTNIGLNKAVLDIFRPDLISFLS